MYSSHAPYNAWILCVIVSRCYRVRIWNVVIHYLSVNYVNCVILWPMWLCGVTWSCSLIADSSASVRKEIKCWKSTIKIKEFSSGGGLGQPAGSYRLLPLPQEQEGLRRGLQQREEWAGEHRDRDQHVHGPRPEELHWGTQQTFEVSGS